MEGQSKRRRDLVKLVRAICPDHSIEYTNGSHTRIVLRHAGKERFVIAPVSPSDRRAKKNLIRDIRAALRKMAD